MYFLMRNGLIENNVQHSLKELNNILVLIFEINYVK